MKLLVVTMGFPPINSADSQRIRLILPYLNDCGWDVDVLSMHPDFYTGEIDPNLCDKFNRGVYVHRVRMNNLLSRLLAFLGVNNFSLLWFLDFYFKGKGLLRKNNYDIVFFSSTAFNIFFLGVVWKFYGKFKLVIDLQDPWFDVNRKFRWRPFFSQFKNRIDHSLLFLTESFVSTVVNGIVAVSESYITDFKSRHRCRSLLGSQTIPFPYDLRDLIIASSLDFDNSFYLPECRTNIVHVGAVSPDMREVIVLFLRGFMSSNLCTVKFSFIGTNYRKMGCDLRLKKFDNDFPIDIVSEFPNRIGYFHALSVQKNSDVILIPGSLDLNYVPSKLFNLLAMDNLKICVCNKDSELFKILDGVRGVEIISYASFSELRQKSKDFFSYRFPYFLSEDRVSYKSDLSAEKSAEVISGFFNEILRNEK